MNRVRVAVAAAAALLPAPLAGSAAATSCSPNVGPYPCPVQADASVSGAVDSCQPMIGAPGWYCNLDWYEYFAGGAVTPGTVTISEYGFPIDGGCQWITTGCSGTRIQNQLLIISSCGGTVSKTFEFEATATSVLGTVTDYATSTLTFANPWTC